jgi:hypothetical protein
MARYSPCGAAALTLTFVWHLGRKSRHSVLELTFLTLDLNLTSYLNNSVLDAERLLRVLLFEWQFRLDRLGLSRLHALGPQPRGCLLFYLLQAAHKNPSQAEIVDPSLCGAQHSGCASRQAAGPAHNLRGCGHPISSEGTPQWRLDPGTGAGIVVCTGGGATMLLDDSMSKVLQLMISLLAVTSFLGLLLVIVLSTYSSCTPFSHLQIAHTAELRIVKHPQ